MASPATARASSLHPDDWLRAARKRLADHGIESVRIEVLARDLAVSKGSFYWHFRDRSELLEQLLAHWEREELDWLTVENCAPTAARWATFIERSSYPEFTRLEAALRAWGRVEERVASCVAEIDRRKARLVANVLRDIGFTQVAAESCSEVILLISLGWLNRAARDREFQPAGRGLGELLSELILAASARSSAPSP